MHDQGIDARRGHRIDERGEELVVIAIVDADAALDRHRQMGGIPQAAYAVGDQCRLQHEAGAKRTILYAVARAAHVQVDFSIAGRFADARGLGQFHRVAAAQLQRDRMLPRIVVEQLPHVAAHNRRGHDHFRVEQRMRGIQPVQKAAMPVGPIHHWSDAQPPIYLFRTPGHGPEV